MELGIGLEYSATDRLKLRAGYEPRASAILMINAIPWFQLTMHSCLV